MARLPDTADCLEPQEADELLPLVYEELRRLAHRRMSKEPPGQTLQATALVHDVWLRLLGPEGEQRSWNSPGHFFGAAAQAMRRILVDRARSRQAARHGGDLKRVNLCRIEVALLPRDEALLALDAALEELEAENQQCAQLVKLRFFAGLNMKETAAALEMSERSAERAWTYARAWLHTHVKGQLGP